MRALLLLIPIELVSLVIVAAGLAIVVGARTFGRGLLMFAGAMVFLPVVLAPLLDALPEVLLWVVVIGLGASLLLGVLRAASAALIGRNATDSMVGSLAAGVVRSLVRAVAGAFAWPVRLLVRSLREMWRP